VEGERERERENGVGRREEKEGTIIKTTRDKQKKKERAIEVKELKSGERGYERERER
jgi:hypothetical protein